MDEYWRVIVGYPVRAVAHGTEYGAEEEAPYSEVAFSKCIRCCATFDDQPAEDFLVAIEGDGTITPIGDYWCANELPESLRGE